MRVLLLLLLITGGCSAAPVISKTFNKNDGTTTFIKVAGTDKMTAAEWKKACVHIPADARFIKVTMGTGDTAVTDYFRPIKDKTYCEMMQSNQFQLHSPFGANPYTSLAGLTDASEKLGLGAFATLDGNTGVTAGTHTQSEDDRKFFSKWGHETETGGCCATAYATTSVAWSQAFEVAYLPKHIPPNIYKTLFASNGEIAHNAEFWATKCKEIPENTFCLGITFGDHTDYFKPTPGTSWCDMLVSRHKHMYSNNGCKTMHAVVTDEREETNGYGGSAPGWLITIDKNDKRLTLSFWGSSATDLETPEDANTKAPTTAARQRRDGSGEDLDTGNSIGDVDARGTSTNQLGGKGSLSIHDATESTWGTGFEVHLIEEEDETDWAMIIGAIVGGVVALTLVVFGVLYAMKKGPFSSGSSMGTRMKF